MQCKAHWIFKEVPGQSWQGFFIFLAELQKIWKETILILITYIHLTKILNPLLRPSYITNLALWSLSAYVIFKIGEMLLNHLDL